ncbi:superoxide dismutase family protein [Aquabacterium sp. A7-Y]|uniref:superoxide dismutase family protein n=1 Tax=Aquabacterium sp. A7-Y TaxID=1349605 RepID=UPI00223CE054|nr:superoxide dismutase family protein [Aquabacterium sp. A7-Y]MCW7538358.1 superoxide dismutase family protein [Aquabacterium sp. A7-Y]
MLLPQLSLTAFACVLALVGGAAAAQAPGARAVLLDERGREAGQVRLSETPDGLSLDIEVQGLAPGAHGVHIHQNGECAPGPDADTGSIVAFGAAGPHFDPRQSRNHGHPEQPMDQVHGGDLPKLQVGSDGRARQTVQRKGPTLRPGPAAAMGRTVVVHERSDDYVTDPAGNSGARLLCGVIEPHSEPPVPRHTLPGSDVFPEGIAVDEASGVAYVGSSSEGHLYKLEPGKPRAELLSYGGSPGRQAALGLKLDTLGRLWVAGGAAGTVALVDAHSGQTLAVLKTPHSPHPFINDLVISSDGFVYVTDSQRPVLFRARNVANQPTALEPWLDLARTPIRYVDGAVNLNGMVVTPDGRYLVAVQTATGQLWRIDTRSREVRQIEVDGALLHGDGLVLQGRALWVLRNVENEIARVELDAGYTRGRVTQRLTSARLKHPSTAALARGTLKVVNSQLDRQKNPPPLLPFDVIELRLP